MKPSVLSHIASHFSQPGKVLEAIEKRKIRPAAPEEYLAPRTEVEDSVAKIWAKLLRLDKVGLQDNFFRLGGHSLLATQMLARLRQACGVELPLRVIFDSPTLGSFAQQVEDARRSGEKQLLPPLVGTPDRSRAPLSLAQQRLWFLDQLEPGNSIFNMAQLYWLRGVLQPGALEESLNEVLRRHAILRTTVQIVNDQPFQVIAARSNVRLVTVDLSHLAPTEAEAEALRIAQEEAMLPFDLSKGPLLRTTLLRLGPELHALMLNMHHIVSDRWSLGVLAQELSTCYDAFATGHTSGLAELTVQYADFAEWQRQWLRDRMLQEQIEYWKERLAGAPRLLELPTDHPRPAVESHRGASATQLIAKGLVDRLASLCEREEITLFMGLLAVFQVLLERYSGQHDIIVGSPIANRDYAEVEPLIGFFVNTLALRTDLSGNPTYRQLLARVRETCLGAYAHQVVPFERLVEELQPQRSLSHNPIFQVMFALQNAPMQSIELHGLRLERQPVYTPISTFDMACFAVEGPEGLRLRVEYNTDLFDDGTIKQMLEHFGVLLQGAVADPEQAIDELPLMGPEEKHRLLYTFNPEPAAFSGLRIHDFFEQQVVTSPDSVALICGEERLSYGDMNRRANQIAHRLIELGVGPDSLVGVFLERTSEMMAAILGILKAGGAYVPLDPGYPKERLLNILEDAATAVVLTQTALLSVLPRCAAHVLCLNGSGDETTHLPTEDPHVKVQPENLGYVLFTSGSTGRPKGVAIEHRSAVALIEWSRTVFSVRELSGVLFSTSICFDLSVFEMFCTLAAGGKIIMAQNALHLPDLPARNEVTLINTVPSAIAELVRMRKVPASVKTVALAGEALPNILVEEVYASTSTERVYNLYGPTEDTTYSTYTLVARGNPVTIGRPITGSHAYILDSMRNPVPIGVPGQLYLAGAGLAREYYKRPELTAERFVFNPFLSEADARMYWTGDLCRWLPDGEIQYLGRLDHQVKIRGFRIELGEIEAVLARHDGVRQSLVAAREDEPHGKQVVAYIVCQPGRLLSSDELRSHIKNSLPDFMVPAAFVFLDAFPLTPNGKVDRSALPTPSPVCEAELGSVDPHSTTEERVAGIFAEVLRVPRVGIREDFFALGGHSLLATQVTSRVRQSFQIELPLREVFAAPTVVALSARIESLRKSPHASIIQRVSREGALPLSFAQQRLWFLDQLEPNSALYNVPLAIQMSGLLRIDLLQRALDEIVRRHEVLRTTFTVKEDRAVQVIAPEFKVQIPLVDLSKLATEHQELEVRRLAIDGARRPFNLETGPLFRASLLHLDVNDYVLLLNTHHIASDGWSIWQFIKELKALYEAFLEDRPSPLPELAIQYADFAVWQRHWMDSGVMEQQLSYWRQQLAGAPDTLALPTDRPRPADPTYFGTTERALFPRNLTDKLNLLSRSEGCTLAMTLLAAYQTLLFRYTHEEDIVVGSPIAGRNRSEIEDLIGFFVNTLVMRTDLSGDPSFRELLRRVRTVALGAYANQDLPFEKLVEALHPNRDLGRAPLFHVWFAMQNAPRSTFELSGLELKSTDVHNGTSKFDLGLFLVEKPEGLSCTVEYSTELFDSHTVTNLLAHFRVLLESIAENPDQRISELTILTAEQSHQLIVEWNEPLAEEPQDACIQELFERQAMRTPDKTAVIFEQSQLTYEELNQRANQLAHRLRALGVGPEVLVGICLERSLNIPIAVLGVLKAGGAYLPIDPAYPEERKAFMLRDGKASVLLIEDKLMSDTLSVPLAICLDKDADTLAKQSIENLPSLARPENLAYVIYTSGSTGKSKGVMITHANVTRLFRATDHWFSFGCQDTWTLFHSFAFDFSVWEIWGALLYGGRLIVVPRLIAQSAEAFHDLLIRHRVTVLNQTPSAFRYLIEADGQSGRSDDLNLRVVIFGGEALEFSTLSPWFKRHGEQPILVNMYGITETTVHVTYFRLPVSTGLPGTGSIVGQRIPDLQTYILDRHMKPVPIGVSGELYVGGGGLARGYLNRPELTAERFIPHPYSHGRSARLYKTGDLARFLSNGTIEYLGRLDNQVKIRGYRIELGEIEKTLDSHPGVRQSVVLVRDDVPREKNLVAYVAPDPAYGFDDAESHDGLGSEQVSQWAMTFDETYGEFSSPADATFNIVGWDSSYTNQPIDAGEMRVWVDSTAERILALQPRQVWEIGCGTGLLLFRVAPQCDRYYGTDISQASLDYLQRHLSNFEGMMPPISLDRKAAHEVSPEGNTGGFDMVILNSVIQYFPNVDYLIEVIKGAVESIGREGAVFIGDVRSLPLLETFHTSVELHKAPDALPPAQLWQRIQKSMRQEGELLISPEFFTALRRHFPQICWVEIQLKRGRAHNELTRFRYDVVLHIGNPTRFAGPECHWIDWSKEKLNPARLREMIEQIQPEIIGLAGVPNARLQSDIAAVTLLNSGAGPATVGAVREWLRENSCLASAVEPEDLWALEQELPYLVEIRPSRAGVNGNCDVLLRRKRGREGRAEQDTPAFPGEAELALPLNAYANNPLLQKVTGRLIPELRCLLGDKLPEYMMPAAFVLLDAIPLTSNGKVNRKALPMPDRSGQADLRNYVAPRSPIEDVTASIWADVLHLEHIGVEDDFFELGGHSLTATQVVSRVRQAFQVELPLRSLFESPRVAALAEVIERLQRSQTGLILPPIVPAPRECPLPLSFAQQRLWFMDQLEPNNALYNVPRALRMKGILHVKALEIALQGVVERHEILRTTYQVRNDQPVQIIAPKVPLNLQIMDLSGFSADPVAREQEARRVAQDEANKPFRLGTGPAFRPLLLRLDAQDHILMLNSHHIASDGWSGGVLERDLTALYGAALDGKPSPLPELPIQYADYAVWQRNWLTGEVLKKQLEYWRARLGEGLPVLMLPTDRPRPATRTFRGEMHMALLPRVLTDAIHGLSRQEGTTPFMTMLAAFQTLLMYYTGQSEIVLGTDVANRTSVQTEALIGFFVNLLVLRTDLSGDPSFKGLLRRVHSVALGAYAHQDVVFDKLVEELRPERSLSHNPLVQALFVQQNTPKNTSTMPGLALSQFKLAVPSKFDMAVFVSETEKGMDCSWLFNPDLFETTTIVRMANLYQILIEKVTVGAELKLGALMQFLDEAEQQNRIAEHAQYEELSLRRLKKITRRAAVAI